MEQFWSGYSYAGNGHNPINATDPDGNALGEGILIGGGLGLAGGVAKGLFSATKQNLTGSEFAGKVVGDAYTGLVAGGCAGLIYDVGTNPIALGVAAIGGMLAYLGGKILDDGISDRPMLNDFRENPVRSSVEMVYEGAANAIPGSPEVNTVKTVIDIGKSGALQNSELGNGPSELFRKGNRQD